MALEWMARGACVGEDPELFHPIGVTGPAKLQAEEAKLVCGRCSVRDTCLSYALENRIDSGVWGGTSEDERRALKRRKGRSRTAAIAPAARKQQQSRRGAERGSRVDASPARTLIVRSGLSYREIARRAGLDHDVVRRVGSGERGTVNAVTLERIRKGLAGVGA